MRYEFFQSRSHMDTIQSVRGVMNYTVDNGLPPDYYFYEPDPSLKLNPPGTDAREVDIEDGWDRAEQFNVDREGFELREVDASFVRFEDDAAIHREFYPQVVSQIKAWTGAKEVVIFDHTLRRRMAADLKVQTEVSRPAVTLVHSDYTVLSGPQRVREVMGDRAEPLLQRRVAFYNLWKPLTRRVEELPLAMIDAQTHEDADFLRMDLKYSERTGEIYVMRHSDQHRWVYFPHMEAHHALLLKTYDSCTDGRCRFMGHSAFEDPSTPADALPRESIEVRTMAFF